MDKDFYNQNTVKLAQNLLGKLLVHKSKDGITSGIIVETEAYLGAFDPSSHSYKGLDNRNWIMFKEAGYAYVYKIYGIHYCFNITSGAIGVGEGVLIRALEPVEGINLMKKRRNTTNIINLCNGPGKLSQAMNINMDLYGFSLNSKEFYISNYMNTNLDILKSTRIGISKAQDLELRFYINKNPYVSKKL